MWAPPAGRWRASPSRSVTAAQDATKTILAGDPSLPTHAIYRPRDLRPFGAKLLMPIVAFGNGGCRNGSGEFRNFLSDLASHGYLIVAIGPAGDAVVAGSEGRTESDPGLRLCSMASRGRSGKTAGRAATTSGRLTLGVSPSWGDPAAPGRRSKCRVIRA